MNNWKNKLITCLMMRQSNTRRVELYIMEQHIRMTRFSRHAEIKVRSILC